MHHSFFFSLVLRFLLLLLLLWDRETFNFVHRKEDDIARKKDEAPQEAAIRCQPITK